MTQRGPWSVKGIDNRAREVAREAAREEGMTLGAYLNKLILEEGALNEPEEAFADPVNQYASRRNTRSDTHRTSSNMATTALDRLTRRIESAEARSTLAITGIDQSVVGLLSRIENAEHGQQAMVNHVDNMLDDIRHTHESLREKVARLEADDSAETNLAALKSLEDALGKLASHVYEENELVGEEAAAIKARLESGLDELGGRLGSVEAKIDQAAADASNLTSAAADHLSDRVDTLETDVQNKLEQISEVNVAMDVLHSDVGNAVTNIDDAIGQIQARLTRAEAKTDKALRSLEETFNTLDTRLSSVASQTPADMSAELRRQFEDRFESLADDLRSMVASTRAEMAEEIEAATQSVDATVIERLESSIGAVAERVDASEGLHTETLEMVGDTVARMTDSVDQRLVANQQQQNRAIEQVGEQVSRISESFDERLQIIEESKGIASTETVREEMLRFTEAMDTRLSDLEARETDAIDRVSSEVEKLADRLNERVVESEQRSASAIEQIGEQVAGVAGRLESRQDDALRLFSEKLDETQKRQESRLSNALNNVSDRLEQIQNQSSATLSPVQKAIAALAQRIEAIEDFATPPFVDRAPSPDLPEMVAPDPIVPDLPDDSGASFDTAPDPTVPEQELARLDEAEPVEEFEAGFDTWAEEANAVLDATLPPTDLAPPPPPIEDDFLAEHYYISDLPGPQPPFDDSVLWNDGGDEARDSDIFEDIASDMDLEVDPQVDTMDAEAAFEAAAVPLEEDTSDYISRARAAAKAAAEPASTNRQPRAGRVPSAAKGNGKVPAIAAVSTLAVVIAGTAGFLHLRGKQAAPVLTLNKTPDTTAQPDATLSTPTDTAPTENSLAAVANRIEGDTITGIAPPLAGDQVPSIGEEAPLNAGSPAQLDEQSLAGEEDLPTLDGAAPDKEARLDTNAPVRLATLGQPRIPARITLEDAAAVGDPIAKYDLALKRFQDGQPGLAADLVQQAADAGLVIAQYKLAKLHEQGLGVPRSLEAARDWTTQAASGGNVKAMHDLAVYMTNGEGGEQSYALAAEWYRKAAEFGVVDSQYNLGVFYQDGLGISPSLSEALFWFEVAARQGDQDAAANVSDLRERVSLEAAQQAQRRAQTWRAARADGIANGVLGAQPWNTQTREQVLAIQETLNGLGYDAGTADGLMGAKTRQAILAFQRSAKLDDTGTVTNALIDALNTAAIDARRAG